MDYLPSCLPHLVPSSTGLDFLLGEMGLFEEAYTERAPRRAVRISLGQQTPQRGRQVTGANISSINEHQRCGVYTPGAKGAPTPPVRRCDFQPTKHESMVE
ncbi:hypothetical protein INR49_005872 [Caranx melampygus]|nr:hypothetical protein INR49_005872 [Caranx melampygus]